MLTLRTINICDICSEIPTTNPENVVLRLTNNHMFDIGALCYLVRESSDDFLKGKSKKIGYSKRVVLSSLSDSRCNEVKKLIDFFRNQFLFSGNSVATLQSLLSRFIAFMGWADENACTAVLDDPMKAIDTLNKYTDLLLHKMRTNQLSVNSASAQQAAVAKVIDGLFSIEAFKNNVTKIRRSLSATKVTTPPDEQNQGKVLSLCNNLFKELSSFVIHFKPYPLAITVPEYMKYPENKLWIFPGIKWFANPQEQTPKKSSFNFERGCILTYDELRHAHSHNKSNARTINSRIQKAQNQLDLGNADRRNTHRLHQAMNAQNFFIILFLAETGMNWSQLVNLPWSEEYQTDSAHQRFRTIKWRANNRTVSFEISRAFLPKFKMFMGVRQYLLNGEDFPLLFFKVGNKGKGKISPIKSVPNATFKTLQRIDPSLEPIMSKQWRASKSDWLIRSTDPATTAQILQNSEKTVLQSYAAGSHTLHMQEMTNFLNGVSNTVLRNNDYPKSLKALKVGVCANYGSPQQEIPSSFRSDCNDFEGCLFCDKYKVHANDRDTKKLVSFKYCIQKTSHLAATAEKFNSYIKPLVNRIDDIIKDISKQDYHLVHRVTNEVYQEGELDHYWQRKLEMLIEIGLINESHL